MEYQDQVVELFIQWATELSSTERDRETGPRSLEEDWDRFLSSQTPETASELRNSAYGEAMFLFHDFLQALIHERRTGDSGSVEAATIALRAGGRSSFGGDRQDVRKLISELSKYKDEFVNGTHRGQSE